MPRILRSFLILFFLLAPGTVHAVDVDLGQRVKVVSSNPKGVPLHKDAKPSMTARIPNGSIVTVIDFDAEKHWLQVRVPGGTEGWIVEKYVDEVLPGPPASNPEEDAWQVWSSPAGCDAVVSSGSRMAVTSDDVLRIGAWNIRWFPDGTTATDVAPEKGTDLSWLACVITWMNLDILAIEEIRAYDHAQDALESVVDGLTASTGGDWRVDLQNCGGASSQHVGYLWNANRVDLSNAKDLWEFNGAAESASELCQGHLRPGRYVRVKAPDGIDFHMVVVHLDMGTKEKDYGNRKRVFERIQEAMESYAGDDTDIIILGDFNIMGKGASVSAEEESDALTSTVATESPGFAHLDVSPECTEYYSGKGGWLDHILVTSSMEELLSTAGQVSGYCALANCTPLEPENMPPAYERLSDHCPVILELRNEDLDP